MAGGNYTPCRPRAKGEMRKKNAAPGRERLDERDAECATLAEVLGEISRKPAEPLAPHKSAGSKGRSVRRPLAKGSEPFGRARFSSRAALGPGSPL